MKFFANNADYKQAVLNQKRDSKEPLFQVGGRVYVNNPKHPHYMAMGELLVFEKYGLTGIGWRIKPDDEGDEFYAKTKDIFPCYRNQNN